MAKPIYFKFEHFDKSQCAPSIGGYLHLNRDHIGNFLMEHHKGFRFSQVVDSMLYYYSNVRDPEDTIVFQGINDEGDNGYIIPVAVQYHPDDWTDMSNGVYDPTRRSIFELIHPAYLKDLQDGKAILFIDQSVEGYSTSWLWEWFHKKCDRYRIPPESIMYLTGDQSCIDTYKEWCTKNNPHHLLKVIPSISLSMYIKKHYVSHNLTTKFSELMGHKMHENRMYLFDCTNMRPRPQRVINYMHLVNSGLASKGNISMPPVSKWVDHVDLSEPWYFTKYGLPLDVMSKVNPAERKAVHKHDVTNTRYYNYVERILADMYRNSWVSLITESSYFEHECSAFVSEKSFKPIACMQPFITLGSRHTLKYLRNLGYKTFSPFIDESYDDMDDNSRFLGIINALKKIEAIEDKANWYYQMKDILEHNFNLFMKIGTVKSAEHTEIAKYYFEYFKDKNVS